MTSREAAPSGPQSKAVASRPAGQSPLPWPHSRAADSHKGDFGRLLLIGGSRGMSGAIALAGMAALRSGAGLVTLAAPSACADVVAGFEPSYMTRALPSDEDGRIDESSLDDLLELAESADCVALGPGLGKSPGLTDMVARLFQTLPVPMVIDADALNALAAGDVDLRQAPAARILTPHAGEFRRLMKADAWDRGRQVAAARSLAAGCPHLVVLLKGAGTFIAGGTSEAINTTGNPGMATGGAGDVLTGVITALVGQGLCPFDAARVAAHVHGLAGDLAAEAVGQVSLIASDLIHWLPAAHRKLADGEGPPS